MSIENVLAKRQTLANQVAECEQALAAAKLDLTAFDAKLEAAFGKVADEPVKKLRGRAAWSEASKRKAAAKAKARREAKEAAKKPAKAKTPAKKPTQAKKPATKKAKPAVMTAQSKKSAATGRQAVARGDRPPLKEAMVTVMGDDTVSSEQVIAALKTKGWMPDSKKPRQYISFMFSSNPEVFKRVGRGLYRVAKGTKAKGNGDSKKPQKAKPAPAAAKPAPAAAKPAIKTAPSTSDAELNEMFGLGTPKATQATNTPS